MEVLYVFRRIILKCVSTVREFQASAAKQIRTALFWVITEVSGRLVGPILTTEDGTIGCPETSERNCHPSLRNNPEERNSLVLTNSK